MYPLTLLVLIASVAVLVVSRIADRYGFQTSPSLWMAKRAAPALIGLSLMGLLYLGG